MSYRCVHCGSEGRIMVQATISAPGSLAHQFSKTNLRRKDVYLMGVNWETMDFLCGNPKCGRVRDGYGNYVTNLKKRANRLESALINLLQVINADKDGGWFICQEAEEILNEANLALEHDEKESPT